MDLCGRSRGDCSIQLASAWASVPGEQPGHQRVLSVTAGPAAGQNEAAVVKADTQPSPGFEPRLGEPIKVLLANF